MSSCSTLGLLRFSDETSVDFSDKEVLGGMNVTLAELAHHGPGLVIDYQKPGAERVLLWAE